MWISHRKEIRLRWLIHIINPVDKTQLSRYTSHRRSTTVSLETYPSILLMIPLNRFFFTGKLAELCQWTCKEEWPGNRGKKSNVASIFVLLSTPCQSVRKMKQWKQLLSTTTNTLLMASFCGQRLLRFTGYWRRESHNWRGKRESRDRMTVLRALSFDTKWLQGLHGDSMINVIDMLWSHDASLDARDVSYLITWRSRCETDFWDHVISKRTNVKLCLRCRCEDYFSFLLDYNKG